jgi:glycerol-3-phosphate acyltransferase PlsY
MPWIIFAIAISYLIGSIPTAYIFGRVLKGIDIRNFGSGNVGATNAFRLLGKAPGITVLILDIIKGFVAVLFLGNFISLKVPTDYNSLFRIILGISCILGHNWTIFLGFKGGKGVATTLGVLLGLSIKIPGLKLIIGLLILTWLSVFIISRTVSLASVLASISLPIYMAIFRQSPTLIVLSILLCVFSILRHKSNIKRILEGKEPRLNLMSRQFTERK